MARILKSRMYGIIIALSVLGIIIAVGYVLGQQANKDRIIEIEIGVKAKKPVGELFKAPANKLFFDEVQQLRKAGKIEEALAKCQEFLAQNPESDLVPVVYLQMSICYTQIRKPKLAIAQYKKIISEYPNFSYMPAVLLGMSNAYEMSEEYDNALLSLQQIIDKYPNTRVASQAQSIRGNIYYWQEKYETALEEYKKVLDDELPENKGWRANALYMMGESYRKLKEYDKALQVLQRRIKDFGSHAQTEFNIGCVYHSAGRYDEAVSAFNKMVKEYPEDHNAPTAQYYAGTSLEAQGKTQEAIEAYQQLIENHPACREQAQNRIDFLSQK